MFLRVRCACPRLARGGTEVSLTPSTLTPPDPPYVEVVFACATAAHGAALPSTVNILPPALVFDVAH